MSVDAKRAGAADFDWYHTIDLGEGVVTAGLYDHRPLDEQALVPSVGGDVGEAGAAALGGGPVGDVDASEPDYSVRGREPDDRLDERSLT